MPTKMIWITGGSSGIGFATAKKFLKNNWTVIISSSNNDKLKKAKEKISLKDNIHNLYTLKCNIADKEEVNNTNTNSLRFLFCG